MGKEQRQRCANGGVICCVADVFAVYRAALRSNHRRIVRRMQHNLVRGRLTDRNSQRVEALYVAAQMRERQEKLHRVTEVCVFWSRVEACR